ncbi:unnamed protein product [Caenorhabditis auriculariae]|uniref:Ig-like domain-containing protein n=1 Tax=Caenorhabditis auriculariae TaxID=2777116 RepID=A0A8S1HQK1_9PELO|nr:unnamed protein product [Caenorhabditis auriculariae]
MVLRSFASFFYKLIPQFRLYGHGGDEAMLILLLTAFIADAAALGGRGSKTALNLVAGRTSDAHALHGVDPVTIWCSPDNPQVAIKTAQFVRVADGKKFKATLSTNKKNATLTIAKPTIVDAGEYTCELETQHGPIRHQIYVYARPVALINIEHFTVKDDNEFHLEGPGLSVEKGHNINITCPVTGYPPPIVKWTKDGAPLELGANVELSKTTIQITNAEYKDGGKYSCEAINEYSANAKTSRLLLVIEKMLNVKSEMAWLLPLAVILVMLILLGLIIFFCELRKRKQSKSARYVAAE